MKMEKVIKNDSIRKLNHQLKEFNNTIKNLYEVDIGDFKRKVLLYLSRCQEKIQEQDENNSLAPFFYGIREMIICNNTTDIETLRLQIIERVKKDFYIINE